MFIPDNAFEDDGTTIRKIEDKDIRTVTEYDNSKVNCLITGKKTNWEQVQTYLELMRGRDLNNMPIKNITSFHSPRD